MQAVVIDGEGGAASVSLPHPWAASSSAPPSSSFGEERRPRPGEMLIAVRVCAVDRADVDEAGIFNISAGGEAADAGSGGEAGLNVIGVDFSGVIIEIGDQVEDFSCGDAVVGMLPRHGAQGGCAEYVVVGPDDVVAKPPEVSHDIAASALTPGVEALSGLVARVRKNDFVMVCAAATHCGILAVQVAIMRGAYVFACTDTDSGLERLQQFVSGAVRVIDTRAEDVSVVVSETNELGVDHVFEASCAPTAALEEAMVPSSSQIVDCLAAHATWSTCRRRLQLDPPESAQLALRGAQLAFVYAQSWVSCKTKRGSYLHLLEMLMRMMAEGALVPKPARSCTMLEAPQVLVAEDVSDWRVVVKISEDGVDQ